MTTKLTANQTVILDQIRAGAGTDAEIGESLPTMKLSAISSSVRGLIKRSLLEVRDGRYVTEDMVEPDANAGTEFADNHPIVGTPFTDDEVQSKMRALQEAGSEFKTTKSGDAASVITVSGGYATTDGQWAMLKGESDDKKNPWTLYQAVALDTVDGYLNPVGTYKSSTAACQAVLGLRA